MERGRGIAYCGLACCLCTKEDCPGCKKEGCAGRCWCKNYRCCSETGRNGCWECENFPCAEGILMKTKPRAFAAFVREYGEEKLFDCLERNERGGVVYHRKDSLEGDYDLGTEEEIFRLLLEGKK